MEWTGEVLTFTNLAPVRQQAQLEALGAVLVVAVLTLLALYLVQHQRIERQKRNAKQLLEQVNADLEQEVYRRTQELTQANDALRKEVLGGAGRADPLRRAGRTGPCWKDGRPGQLAASITHELTQPLGGIRNLGW